MIEQGDLHLAMPQITAFAIHKHDVAKHHFNLRILCKKIQDPGQSALQILFVAIEISHDITSCPAQPAIDCIIHALIFLNEDLYTAVFQQPIEGSVVRAGILNDMLAFNLLVGNGGDAEFQPGRTTVAGCDDRNDRRFFQCRDRLTAIMLSFNHLDLVPRTRHSARSLLLCDYG